MLVRDRVGAVQPDLPRVPVDADRAGAGADVDTVLGVPAGIVDLQLAGLALQVGLGQRGPLVRQLRLVADQRDRFGVSALAQGLDRVRGGKARADQDGSGLRAHGPSPKGN